MSPKRTPPPGEHEITTLRPKCLVQVYLSLKFPSALGFRVSEASELRPNSRLGQAGQRKRNIDGFDSKPFG